MADHEKYMEESIKELKASTNRLLDDQRGDRESLIRLSENLLELQRFNKYMSETLKELKDYNNIQDKRINDNSTFIIKATAICGFVSFITPVAIWFFNRA